MAEPLWAEIPVIDFAAFPVGASAAVSATGPTAAQRATAAEIERVCRVHGFLKLRNTGVSEAHTATAFDAARELFALPAAHKAKLSHHDKKGGTNRGYFPPDTEALNAARANDVKEAFNVRRTAMDFRGTPPRFAAEAESFYERATELADRVMLACAVALGLEPTFFAERHREKNLCTLRLLHYPPVGDAAAPGDEQQPRGRVRAGEHTDFGLITLLFVDAAGGAEAARGLQVRRPDGADDWLDVDAEPGTVVVNTGGLLAQWTNDAWIATAHRVVVTPAALALPRYSIALFVDPDEDVLVECLPGFCGPDRPAKYAPITSNAYLLAKLAEAQRVTSAPPA